VKSGRLGWKYMGVDSAGRLLRGFSQRQSAQILMEAMLDPDLARNLLVASRGSQTPAKAQRLLTYLIGVGLGPDEDSSSDEGEGESAPMLPGILTDPIGSFNQLTGGAGQ